MIEWLPKAGEGLLNSLRTAGSKLFKGYPSGAALLKDLRDGGVRIATSTFYEVRRQVLGLVRYEEQIKNLLPGTLIPQTWTDIKHGLSISGEYLYRMRYDVIDPNTGESETNYTSVLSNDQLTVLQAKEQAMYVISETPTSEPTLIADLELFQSLRRPGQ